MCFFGPIPSPRSPTGIPVEAQIPTTNDILNQLLVPLSLDLIYDSMSCVMKESSSKIIWQLNLVSKFKSDGMDMLYMWMDYVLLKMENLDILEEFFRRGTLPGHHTLEKLFGQIHASPNMIPIFKLLRQYSVPIIQNHIGILFQSFYLSKTDENKIWETAILLSTSDSY